MRISFLGGLSSIGKSSLLVEDEAQALLIDAGAAVNPGASEYPDFRALDHLKKKLCAVCITHAHSDHAGGVAPLCALYPHMQFYASRETMAFLHGRYDLPQTARAHVVTAGTSFHIGDWELTPIAARHSVPGALALHIALPKARVLISGDFRSFADDGALARFASPDIFICESTNAALPGAPVREEEVHTVLRALIAEHARARILFTCFSTNLERIRTALEAAYNAGMAMYADGEAMRNSLRIARGLYGDPFLKEYPAVPRDKLPASGFILTSGGQGEDGSRLLALIKSGCISRREDALILSASPIPGNEGNWRFLLNTAAREPARLYLPPRTPSHASGHAARDGLREVLGSVRPRLLLPVHGDAYQRRELAELAQGMGIDSRILSDAEDVSLEEGEFTFSERLFPEQGSDGAQDILRSGAGERQALARTGIAFVAVIASPDARRAEVKISVRGFFRNDAQKDFLDAACAALEADVLELWSEGVFAQSRIRQNLQRQMQKRFTERFADAPLVSVLYHEV